MQGDLRRERIVQCARKCETFGRGQKIGARTRGRQNLQADSGVVERPDAPLAEILKPRVDFGAQGGRIGRRKSAPDDKGGINPTLELRECEMFFKSDDAHVSP